MNKIFSNKIITNSITKNINIWTNVISKNNLLTQTKKTFSIDYADMEKKLEKYYETTNKENIEKLKSFLSEKEKKEADLVFNHLINLSDEEKDYIKVKMDFEYRKLNMNMIEPQYTLSNSKDYNPIEVDGNLFGFGENVTQKLSSFYGQAAANAVSVEKPKEGAQDSNTEADAGAKKESSYYDIKLAGFDAGKKLALIKEIRTYLGLGLKEAKELVEKAPTVIKTQVHKLEAEELKTKLTGSGAVIEFC